MTEDEKPASQDSSSRRRGSAAAEKHGKDLLRRKQAYERQLQLEQEQEQERERQLEQEKEREQEGARPGREDTGPSRRTSRPLTAAGGALGPVITSRPSSDETAEDKVLLIWRIHLLTRNPKTTTWLAIAIIAGLSLVWISFHSIGWVVLSAILLLGSISTFILPITYTLTEKEVRMRSLLTNEVKPWRKFAGFNIYPDAVQVTFDSRTFRGRMLRGYTLYFEGNREEIMAIVREKIKPRSP